MTESLMPHVIAQSVFQPQKDINKTAWKYVVAFHLLQQAIRVHSSLEERSLFGLCCGLCC